MVSMVAMVAMVIFSTIRFTFEIHACSLKSVLVKSNPYNYVSTPFSMVSMVAHFKTKRPTFFPWISLQGTGILIYADILILFFRFNFHFADEQIIGIG